MNKILFQAAQKILAEAVKAGGELVTPEQAQARLEICYGCEHKGIVTPLPLMQFEGCTICGCPFMTKPHMKTVFNLKEMSLTEVDCPKKKWASTH